MKESEKEKMAAANAAFLKMSPKGRVVTVGIFFALALGFTMCAVNVFNPGPAKAAPVVVKPDTAENQDPYMALGIAEKFVTKGLKSPSTAKFPVMSDDGVKVSFSDKGFWVVSAYVDSQNSFGATLRTGYILGLDYLGSKQWKLHGDITWVDQ